MTRYAITVEAESLPELVGALTDAASLLQAGDAGQSIAVELMPLAEPPAMLDPSLNAPLPTPPPDYQAAGLTDFQAIQARQAMAGQAVAVAPLVSPTSYPAPVPTSYPAPANTPQARPFCSIHNREMEWKGGGLSKAGKGLPLWSCPDRNCREAIWPPR